MSEAPDKESKTEQPSEKRFKDSVEKGNVPFSPELGILSSLVALLVTCTLIAAAATAEFTGHLASMIENAATLDLQTGADAVELIGRDLWAIFAILLPVLCVFMLGGVVGPLAQNAPQANLERIVPKAERISPGQNIKRILGKRAFFEFAKMLLKVIAVCGITYWSFKGGLVQVFRAAASDVGTIPATMLSIAKSIIAPLCLVALVIAVADVIVSRLRWIDGLRMTRQELKDEHKQAEGDPHIKQRIRMLGRQRLKKRMMADLPRATLVVANPTHYAVALRYVPAEGGAPLVIAKGVDHLAQRIRSACQDQGIAVIENKALARSLYPVAEVGAMIPPEFYRAVAEVIHFVEMRKKLALKPRLQA
jgi:flagellar biosynthetic protein FlhB